MPDDMTVDELLAKQESGGNLATIESVEDDADKLKITPWRPGSGCLCHLAITIPKDAVESVRDTETRHMCCDKVLHVVELRFQKGSSIALSDLFQQVSERLSSQTSEAKRPFDAGRVSPRTSTRRPPIPTRFIAPKRARSSLELCQIIADYDPPSEELAASCYPDCFGECVANCPTIGLFECVNNCQSACNALCTITCEPCHTDETFNSTRSCCQGGSCWVERCGFLVEPCQFVSSLGGNYETRCYQISIGSESANCCPITPC